MGGGVVAEILVMAEIFQVTADEDQSNYFNSGNFFFTFTGHLEVTHHFFNYLNSLQKKNIYQKFGGAWPPCPPWLRHYILSVLRQLLVYTFRATCPYRAAEIVEIIVPYE